MSGKPQRLKQYIFSLGDRLTCLSSYDDSENLSTFLLNELFDPVERPTGEGSCAPAVNLLELASKGQPV